MDGRGIPLGYDVKNRALFVNQKEAELVNHIFRRCIELKSSYKLFKELKAQNIKGKERVFRTGEKIPRYNFSHSAARHVLKNPVYIGKIRHKSKIYQGHHKPIISDDLWHDVQNLLIRNSAVFQERREIIASKNLLRGRIYDKDKNPYITVDTHKGGKRYRYYKAKNYSSTLPEAIRIISAHKIEDRVDHAIRHQIFNLRAMRSLLNLSSKKLLQSILARQHVITKSDLIRKAVKEVIVHDGHITVEVNVADVYDLLMKKSEIAKYAIEPLKCIKIMAPYISRRAHQKIIIIEPDGPNAYMDKYFNMPITEFKNLVRGMIWRSEHFEGLSIQQIARRENFSNSFIEKCIFKTFE